MNLRWFVSKNVRTARAMRKHVRKILDSQRDLLTPPAITAVQEALNELDKAAAGNGGDEALKQQMINLENTANKWLKPYPNAVARENIEVLLVALAVALGIRTFFLQPFKIPTASMQPTLFGVTSVNLLNQPQIQIPGRVSRFLDYWLNGDSYFEVLAPEDGKLEAVMPPSHLLLFNSKQQYVFNGKSYTVWFPADDLFQRAGYEVDSYGNGPKSVIQSPYAVPGDPNPVIKAGQPIFRLKVTAGDHLFVDRLSYNFRHPSRGEIIVFETRGIGNAYRQLPDDQFYIKRLVGLPGEHIQLGNDRHLVIDGKRLDKDTPHFENVYSFDTNQWPQESHYSGHVYTPELAPIFRDARRDSDGSVIIRPGHYMVMGDNTLNSLDSRAWGDFPETNIMGKFFCVYWPFSSRVGWTVK